ncbi:MAG: M23 family metallopeptidase [Treponema sp.]|nr:M23 family metallopeptidase [Treponema sp.]
MKSRLGIFCLLSVLFAAFFFPSSLYGEDRVHIVQRGETFFSIARASGVRAEDLMAYNGISDPNRLLAGQRLRIPGQTPANNFVEYRVVRGDTLFGIAGRFSVTVAQIREINGFSENHVLREGSIIRLPATPGTAALSTAQPSNNNTVPLRWPVNAREVDEMTGKLSGVVITGTRGEPVISLTRGTVLSAGPYRGFGRVVIIQVDGGYIYVYGGCESLYVKEGDRVGPGTELGRLGIDAVSNRPQLFFMVYRGNTPIDPALAPRA